MDDPIITYEVQFIFESGENEDEYIAVNHIPPYAVGQSIFIDKKYSNDEHTNIEYTIKKISHAYGSIVSHDGKKEMRKLSIQILLE